MISLALLAGAMAAINRFRGGGLWADRLPGHPRFYAAALVAAVSFLAVGPLDAAIVAGCFLAWSLLPWGRWYSLGRGVVPGREPSDFEIIIGRLPNDYARFTMRNAVGLIPAVAFINPLFLLLALVQTAAYEAGWRLSPATPIRTAELLTGAAWGAFIWWLA
jgi:hypothetical protein